MPDLLANAPMFKRVGPNAMRGRGIGAARGRATIQRGKCQLERARTNVESPGNQMFKSTGCCPQRPLSRGSRWRLGQPTLVSPQTQPQTQTQTQKQFADHFFQPTPAAARPEARVSVARELGLYQGGSEREREKALR